MVFIGCGFSCKVYFFCMFLFNYSRVPSRANLLRCQIFSLSKPQQEGVLPMVCCRRDFDFSVMIKDVQKQPLIVVL